jgi:NAD(P)-dependent dehydrogenase (short-subunit alcohol dehydrogenase family)
MKFAVERFGGLDCVVNNAGAGAEGGPIANISVEGFDRSIALLLRGPFLGIIRKHLGVEHFVKSVHPMLAPALAPRHPLPEFIIPKATAAAH